MSYTDPDFHIYLFFMLHTGSALKHAGYLGVLPGEEADYSMIHLERWVGKKHRKTPEYSRYDLFL